MLDLHKKYYPIVSTPFHQDETYLELEPPADLKPYVRCFWGSLNSFNPHTSSNYKNRLVIPDTCFDIIFKYNRITGKTQLFLTGLSNESFISTYTQDETSLTLFSVRFYFWAMPFLTGESFSGTLNNFLIPELFLPNLDKYIEQIQSTDSFHKKCKIMCNYIRYTIRNNRFAVNDQFLNCISYMIDNRGDFKSKDLSLHTAYSARQLQRIFHSSCGVTPKTIGSLLRYQLLWKDIVLNPNYDLQTAVLKYGYTDQSHLLHTFKQYHSMTPLSAVQLLYPALSKNI